MCVVAISILLLFTPFWTVFSFIETRTESPKIHYVSVKKEKSFQIKYTHSIHLTDVMESYELEPNRDIRLVSMEYEDVAIGMPSYAEEGQSLTYENGIYTLRYDNVIIKDFTLYIGNVDYDLLFLYEGQMIDLKKELTKGNSYLFQVQEISLYEKMKGEKLNGRKK